MENNHLKKYVIAIFDDEDVLLHAIEHIRHAGIKIMEVFTPFPIHGIEEALGFKRSRLSKAAFLFGLTGFICAQSMIFYMMTYDWPMNIGGKSTLAYPDFIPVSFEATVLFSAFGMVGTFLVVSNLLPGVKPKIFDIRATDDKFVMVIDIEKNTKSIEEICFITKNQGASEVYVKEME
jgi:hypothetical protein